MNAVWKSVCLAMGIVAAVASAGGIYPAAVAAAPKGSVPLTVEEHREVIRLLAEFRTAGHDMDKRQKVIDKVLAIGPAAAIAASAAVERELCPQTQRYIANFQQQAVAAGRTKVQEANPNEVLQLRQTILGLQLRGPGFTKEAIENEGDPALKRLNVMLVVDRAKLLEASESLQAERKRLGAMEKLWQQCQEKLPAAPVAKGKAPPKPPKPSFDHDLEAEEQLTAALATPMDAKTRAVLTANARLADKLDPEEVRTILALNLTRNLLGLSALATDVRLCAAARDHSHDMESMGFFSHESPVEGKKTPSDRAARFGTTADAENIQGGHSDGFDNNIGWFHSPGHHKNMLSNNARVGVGRSGTLFTEMFGD